MTDKIMDRAAPVSSVGEPGLAGLLARVEAATGPDRELDADIAVALDGFFTNGTDGWGRPLYCYRDEDRGIVSPGHAHDMLVRSYTASLDAALALVERVLPGWLPRVAKLSNGLWMADIVPPLLDADCRSDLATAPLAICATLLKAMLDAATAVSPPPAPSAASPQTLRSPSHDE